MEIVRRLLREREERKRYFQEYTGFAAEIRKLAENLLGEVEVYVFGSAVEGDYHPVLSDIDVAIVTENRDIGRHLELKVQVQRRFGDVFELHVVNRRQWEVYRRFIGKAVRV